MPAVQKKVATALPAPIAAPAPPEPVAPPSLAGSFIHLTNSGRMFWVVDGTIYERVVLGQSHMPQSRRVASWEPISNPRGWECQQLQSTADGGLYALCENHLFLYGRNPDAQWGVRDQLFQWVEIPSPLDPVAAEAPKPQPTLAHACTGLPGMSATFTLDAGRYVLQANSTINGGLPPMTVERSTGVGIYRPLSLAEGRFELPAPSWLRVYSPHAGEVSVFKLPAEGH